MILPPFSLLSTTMQNVWNSYYLESALKLIVLHQDHLVKCALDQIDQWLRCCRFSLSWKLACMGVSNPANYKDLLELCTCSALWKHMTCLELLEAVLHWIGQTTFMSGNFFWGLCLLDAQSRFLCRWNLNKLCKKERDIWNIVGKCCLFLSCVRLRVFW